MKKLIIVLVIVAAGFVKSMGQSMLKVSTKDNTTQISVSVDDRHFNKRGTSITVGDLPYGGHYLKVYSIMNNRWGRGYEEVIYQHRIKTYNGMITLLVFDPETGAHDVQEMAIDSYTATHPVVAKGKFSGSSQYQSDSRYNNGWDNNNNNNNNNNMQQGSQAASPAPAEKFGTLNETKFNDLKTKVAAKTTDLQKTGLLKDELKEETVTTNQVGDIMDWFIFESSKVDFAKWAYDKAVDKEYFADLESKFAYKTSQDDLDKFIKSQK